MNFATHPQGFDCMSQNMSRAALLTPVPALTATTCVEAVLAKALSTRKQISKRVRFEVFKRDGFRCQYCGITSQDAELQVDHVVPVAGGGRNDMANLATACAECNSGKSDAEIERRLLSTTLERLTEHLSISAEVEEQAAERRRKWIASLCVSPECEAVLRWLSIYADAVDDVQHEWPWQSPPLMEIMRGLVATGFVWGRGASIIEITPRQSTIVSLSIRASWPDEDGNTRPQWHLFDWHSPSLFGSVEAIYG